MKKSNEEAWIIFGVGMFLVILAGVVGYDLGNYVEKCTPMSLKGSKHICSTCRRIVNKFDKLRITCLKCQKDATSIMEMENHCCIKELRKTYIRRIAVRRQIIKEDKRIAENVAKEAARKAARYRKKEIKKQKKESKQND